MEWLNVADIALWAKEHMPPLEDYVIHEVKIKNLGEKGFEVTVAFQRPSGIYTPMVVRRARVDSYGNIVSTNEAKV